MLQNSFIFLDGIGPRKEQSLWQKGVLTWTDFRDVGHIRGISDECKVKMDDELASAEESLRSKNSSYFAIHLPTKEQWRCIGDFRESVAFLDIETTGISYRSPITVVGIYDGARMHTLVRGQNLTRGNLKGILSAASMMVTFNGSSFDLPMIESQFPGVVPEIPHVDVKHPLRRLGYVGGLKRIERDLDIERDRRVEYMTGEDAVYLWHLWERKGSKNALDLLIEYNAEDCRNLKTLAEHSYRSLRRRVFDRSAISHKS